jgi:hypothetical protein
LTRSFLFQVVPKPAQSLRRKIDRTRRQLSTLLPYLGDEALSSTSRAGLYHALTVGARTWNLIQERQSVREIHDTLFEEYDL